MINEILNKSFTYTGPTLEQLLQQKLEKSGLNKTQFEKLAGIERKSLDSILSKTSKQTDINKLIKLGEFLDLSINDLLILHYHERPKEEIKELQESMDITFINKYFDLKTLSNLGFISKKDGLEDLKSRICNFFQLDSIYDYDKELNDVLFSRTKKTYSDKMKDFWIKSSYKYFELINNKNDYDRKSLIDLIPKIKPYTRNVENGLKTVFQALFNIGITVIFQPSLPKTQIRGATFVVNNKPCIVITDFNKNYSTIWFALIHELHHVLYDLDIITKTSYHLTGEPDLFLLQEDRANEFASEYLISNEKMRYIEKLIHNKLMVSRFAEECQIHPCIIYSQFQWRQAELGNDYWAAFKDQFPNISVVTKNLNIANWNVDSIKETAQKMRELLTV
ncbi:XRE family transcriptional regulator [Chryseobacterium arthrosphaerae]|uniref:XRE family transcriptional regulator n=1 Tax=Chryseobacterium arthrosphaerae TaxID=651561 RepID=UPI0023E1574A|nr:XRE family transcriptional regulator [Chryseobacterium arthrosphaerae]WES97722.1 XRE family transcriptional regulator [Chryseobacterium arthrosphaerae]